MTYSSGRHLTGIDWMATFWGMVMQLQEQLCGGCKSLPPSLGMGESYFKSSPLFYIY